MSESELWGINVDARGVEAYMSCRSVRPRDMTGEVA